MTIERALFARLSGYANLSALVSARIYPGEAPQNVADPFVTYQRISGPRVRSIGGPSGHGLPRFQFDAYSRSFATAVSVATQIRKALDGFKGTLTDSSSPSLWSVRIQQCSLQSDRHFVDAEPEGNWHNISADFLIMHVEA